MVLYKYYFQIPVQKEAIRRLTGFSAFNTLWTWLRLSQDIHTASDIAQFVIDWLFERCKTFRWIYGWCLNIQQISRWTLKHRSPMVFCSSECLPMSAFSKKVRVVSKFNASSWTSNRSRLCRLARAKNRRDPNIQVPKHQRSTMVKAMLHVILYACKSKNIPTFSFLRELTKSGGHYKPTPLHEKQFEDVKEVQLDPVWKMIRTPSLDVNYEYFVIPDSSRSLGTWKIANLYVTKSCT